MKDHLDLYRQLQGKKVRDVYTTAYDVRETMFSDQTGQYPTRSQRGHKYIMVMVEIDSNAILVEPMKSRKDAEMIRAYDALLLRLKRAGIIPKKHVLDNEVSENMKTYIRDTCKLNMELVPPGCHRQNAAEVAIRNFKAHFLSVLAGVADNFPPSLWDRLLPQTEITVNLIRQSNATLQMYQHMHTSADPLTTTKCRWRQWDAMHKCMRRPTSEAHGHTIPSMDGISSPLLSIIGRTRATSSTPRANDCPTRCNSNTSASPTPPSHMPIK